jgi:SEC-C motif-containing protein
VRETSHLNDEGLVEFTALYKHDEQLSRLQERSSFVREGGRWLYTTGHLDPAQNGPVED